MDFTRRDFGKLAAAGLAAGAIGVRGGLGAMVEGQRTGYCVVGLGRISVGHFLPGIRAGKQSRVTALVSGHRDKAERIAAEYGVPKSAIYSYEQYDEIAKNGEIDAVYIGLPNSMHAEYTIRAAKAGKHVLCEKPMSTSVADAKAMIAAAKAANKKLMIAYRCQLEPVNLRAIQLIREGKLGTIQAIESANGFNIGAGEWRITRKLGGGGPLMDVGIYSLNACRYLTGEEPAEIAAYSSVIDKDGRFNEVEENVGWTMRFPSGIMASCNTSYGAQMNGFYRVHGSKGTMDVEAAFGYQGQHLKAEINSEPAIDEPAAEQDPAHFIRMADYFSNCVQTNKEPIAAGEEGLRDMELIEVIYKKCGLRLGYS